MENQLPYLQIYLTIGEINSQTLLISGKNILILKKKSFDNVFIPLFMRMLGFEHCKNIFQRHFQTTSNILLIINIILFINYLILL